MFRTVWLWRGWYWVVPHPPHPLHTLTVAAETLWPCVGFGSVPCPLQKAVRDLEEEMQRLRREHRDAQSSLQDEYDRVYKDGVSVKQQLRAAQEREEELQNQVGALQMPAPPFAPSSCFPRGKLRTCGEYGVEEGQFACGKLCFCCAKVCLCPWAFCWLPRLCPHPADCVGAKRTHVPGASNEVHQ